MKCFFIFLRGCVFQSCRAVEEYLNRFEAFVDKTRGTKTKNRAARHAFLWLVLLCLSAWTCQWSSSDIHHQLSVNHQSTSGGKIYGWPQLFRCCTAANFGIDSHARHRKHRGNFFLHARLLYSVNGSSSYQISRLALCGDIQSNPGPARKSTVPKFPCKECGKAVRSNHDAILCSQCLCWSHAKCLQLSRTGFQYYLDHPDLNWVCSLYSLPQLAPEDFMDTSELSASSILLDPLDKEAWNSTFQSEISEEGLDSPRPT